MSCLFVSKRCIVLKKPMQYQKSSFHGQLSSIFSADIHHYFFSIRIIFFQNAMGICNRLGTK